MLFSCEKFRISFQVDVNLRLRVSLNTLVKLVNIYFF